ncbi:cupin-like domain-containing protein [Allosphingosinicella indica]|uniref:Cupin-like domain-containing protein n=1 Tax=Allosphingosinicella indica TaxID=941907 RepID=A0A1X7GHC3_9SPHN|nr:cupin-like domain-containing protein [Allosphingosinicella indica]SMF69762.1 Cupin-like domain-containing protein [Allosphingosinicella indica]
MTAFAPSALGEFRAAYPEQPVLLAHDLCDHPLLTLDSLAALAGRMRPVDVEYNRADLPIGIDPAETPANGLSIAETIRSIEDNGSWMVLKFIEQDAAYRALLHETLAGLAEIVRPATGEMLKLEGFVFISSPDAVTPFHFDPEHNILAQIRGSKVMTIFPAGDPRVVEGTAHEAFHAGGHRNLPWDNKLAAFGEGFPLEPGRAVYVPVKAPHWVKNGPETSISFSITWRSEWSYREEYAHGFNRMLRRAGADPAMPGRFPHQNRAKSLAYRAALKAGRLIGR